DVARDELLGLDLGRGAIPNGLGLVRRVFLQGSDCFLGAALLRDTDYSVQDQDSQNLDQLAMSLNSLYEPTTPGSTKAVQSSPPSKSARTNDRAADPSRISTSWSLNCSSIS